MLAWGSYTHSAGLDEDNYLVAGVSHWQFGRFDLCAVSPPLVRLVAALPVVLSKPQTDWRYYCVGPGARPETDTATDFLRLNGSRSFWFFTLARWAIIPFSWLVACICYRWASELFGGGPGFLPAPFGAFAQIFWPALSRSIRTWE